MTENIIPLGFAALANPIRENAVKTFTYFKSQNVAIKVISGDNPKTVSQIAIQAAIDHAQDYIDATTLDTDEKLHKAVSDYTVFGRVTPKQKQKLVQALQEKGHTVAMTGDGVNDQDILEEEITAGNYALESYYPIIFSDGKAEVVITGSYSYNLYIWSLIIELCFSFALFFGLVLFGIRKKMKYILTLSEEIEILEGGSLEYPITIQGKDELSVLAEGLDSMRKSFKKLINQESEMVRENQRIVTEMSHDLRTPVTSIMLYTEILKKKQYQNEEQLNGYIDKIDRKAHRMKQLTDHLFEYSLVAGKEDVVLEEPELYEVLFYDLFSETCSYLNQHGFKIDFRVKWIDCKIRISTDYLMRIMDNITSNIIKYADPSYEILVSSVQQKKAVGVLFENKIRKTNEVVESTGIGMQNIKNMMLNMGGECKVKKTKEKYCLILLFPCSE